MRRKLAIDPRQIEHRCNRTHLVIVRHHLFKAERIKQLLLIPLQPTHHGPFPPLTASTSGNHCSRKPSTDFCNKICQQRTCVERATQRLPTRLTGPPRFIGIPGRTASRLSSGFQDYAASHSTFFAPGICRSARVSAQLNATVSTNTMGAFTVAGTLKSNSQYCSHSAIG